VMQEPTSAGDLARAAEAVFGMVEEHAPIVFALVLMHVTLIAIGYAAHWFAARNHIKDLKDLFDRFLDREPKP
jgi:hypothetical protein